MRESIILFLLLFQLTIAQEQDDKLLKCSIGTLNPLARSRENACFKVYNTSLNFDESTKFCASQGGKLAEEVTKDDSSLYSANADLDLASEQTKFWIGATNRKCNEYTWNNEKAIEFNGLWAEDSRVYGVAVDKSSRGGLWHTVGVTTPLPFVCTFQAQDKGPQTAAMRSPIRSRPVRKGNIEKDDELNKTKNEQDDIEDSMKAAMADEIEDSNKAAMADDFEDSKKAKVTDEMEDSNKAAMSDEIEDSKKAKVTDEMEDSKKSKVTDETEDSNKASMSDEIEDSNKAKTEDETEDSNKSKVIDEIEDSNKAAMADEMEDSKKSKVTNETEDSNKISMSDETEDSKKAAMSDEIEDSNKAKTEDETEDSNKASMSDEMEDSKKTKVTDEMEDSNKAKTEDETEDSKKAKTEDEIEDSKKTKVIDEIEDSNKATMADEMEDSKKSKVTDETEDSKKAAMTDEMENSKKTKVTDEMEDSNKTKTEDETEDSKKAKTEDETEDSNKASMSNEMEDSNKASMADEIEDSNKAKTENDTEDSNKAAMTDDNEDSENSTMTKEISNKQKSDDDVYEQADLVEAVKCLDNLFDPHLLRHKKCSPRLAIKNDDDNEKQKQKPLDDLDYSDQASLLDELARVGQGRPTCPAEWTQYNANVSAIGTCFRRFETSMTFEEARLFCLKQGGHLASIHNQRQLFLLSALLHNTPNNTIDEQTWIGLNRVHQKYYVYEDESPMDFTRWLPGAPNIHDCTVFTGNELPNYSHKGTRYKFGDYPCEKKQKSVLCEVTIGNGKDKSAPTCDNGWTYYSHDGSIENAKCYKQFIGKANFTTARQICKTNNAYVATVQNAAESRLVSALLKTPQNYSITEQTWIGYVRYEAGEKFEWEDGTDPRIAFDAWAEKLAKNHKCVVFTGNELKSDCRSEFRFVSVDCDEPQRATLCHKPANNGTQPFIYVDTKNTIRRI